MSESIKKDSIAIVVITYNRLNLLKQGLTKILQQTKDFEKIIIVNNGSTDGTKEWLDELIKEQDKILVITQENLGGSGGQYTGFKTAFELGYEWIWIMDDDVSVRENCLEELYKARKENLVLSPLRYSIDGDIFFNEVKSYNLTNPFKSFWKEKISEKDLNEEFIRAQGLTFEGTFFHRSLIQKIGLTEKYFFIYADDTEFFLRAKKAGFDLGIIKSANLDRMLPDKTQEKLHTQSRYYFIRNIMLIDRLHGNLPVKFIRPILFFLKWLLNCKTFSDFKYTFKALKDFIFYRSENGKKLIDKISSSIGSNS